MPERRNFFLRILSHLLLTSSIVPAATTPSRSPLLSTYIDHHALQLAFYSVGQSANATMYTPKERRSLGGKPFSKNNEAYMKCIGTEFADNDRN